MLRALSLRAGASARAFSTSLKQAPAAAAVRSRAARVRARFARA